MKLRPTTLSDVHRIEYEKLSDERGFFARTFCEKEFTAFGLCSRFVQNALSFNPHLGTVRGMHFQAEPYSEVKIITCTRGRIWDVLLDVRPKSPTFGKWEAFELSADDFGALYVGKGLAHGFQTQSPDAEVHYMLSEFYQAELSRGILWNDDEIGIRWPLPVSRISQRDAELPPLARAIKPGGH